jgi:hypothetical protein
VHRGFFFFTWHGYSRLKTWTRQEGAVRLSEDDGPPAHTFLEEDDDELEEEDSESGADDDIRQEGTRRAPGVELQTVGVPRGDAPSLLVNEDAPLPPPKGRN